MVCSGFTRLMMLLSCGWTHGLYTHPRQQQQDCMESLKWTVIPLRSLPVASKWMKKKDLFVKNLENPRYRVSQKRSDCLHGASFESCRMLFCRWSWWRMHSWTSFILEFSMLSWSWKSRRIATSSGLLNVFRRDIVLRSIATFLFSEIAYCCHATTSVF